MSEAKENEPAAATLPRRGLPVPVGARAQCDTPDAPTERQPASSPSSASSLSTPRGAEVGGQLLWRPRVASPEEVDDYLEFCARLFQAPEEDFASEYDEERALFLLMRCGYDTARARELVRPEDPKKGQRRGKGKAAAAAEDAGDDYCFTCADGGELILCDQPGCNKAFHKRCCGLKAVPKDDWFCPRHKCAVCEAELPPDCKSSCVACATSYCARHVPADCRKLDQPEFFCARCLGRAGTSGRGGFLARLKYLLDRRNVQWDKDSLYVGNREVDPYRLYSEVMRGGGYRRVMAAEEDGVSFVDIKKALNIGDKTTNAVKQLVHLYETYLLPYEEYFGPGDPSSGRKRRHRGSKAEDEEEEEEEEGEEEEEVDEEDDEEGDEEGDEEVDDDDDDDDVDDDDDDGDVDDEMNEDLNGAGGGGDDDDAGGDVAMAP